MNERRELAVMIELILISGAGILDTINPLAHVSQEGYSNLWAWLYATFLNGIWARIFAAAFLAMAFWLGVYRRRTAMGIVLLMMSIVVTYMGGMVGVMFWWAK